MLTMTEVIEKLFDKNLDFAKSYIKEILKQSPWITTPAGEDLIERLVATVLQLPDIKTRIRFVKILKELPRFFQNCKYDLQIALFTKLSQCSVDEIKTLCDELPELFIKCADTPVQPLHYVLHLPKHCVSIIHSILNLIKNKDRPVQEQICNLLSEFTPRAVMLLFGPDVIINSEKRSVDVQRERFITTIADLATGKMKRITFEKLMLMMLDDSFVDLLEKQWLSLDNARNISIEKIQLYKQLLKCKIPLDAIIVRIISLLETSKVKLLTRFVGQERDDDLSDQQVIPLIIEMFAVAPDYLKSGAYYSILQKCVQIIKIIGVDLLRQTHHIKMGLVSKQVLSKGRVKRPFFLYLVVRLCMNNIAALPEELLNLLKIIMQRYVAKEFSDTAFCAAVSALVNNHPLLQKSSPLVERQEELFEVGNSAPVVEQPHKWRQVQMDKCIDRQAQQSAIAQNQLTHQGQEEEDNLLHDKANNHEHEQKVKVDLQGAKANKLAQEKLADSRKDEVNSGEQTDELVTWHNRPSLPGIHTFFSIANRRDKEIFESKLARAATMLNNTGLNPDQMHSTFSLPMSSFSQGAHTLAPTPDASLLSNMGPAIKNDYLQVGRGNKRPAPPSAEEGHSIVSKGSAVFFAPKPVHDDLFPGVNLLSRSNADAPIPAKKAKVMVLPIAPGRNSSVMFRPVSPASNQTAISQPIAPAEKSFAMWQLFTVGETSTKKMAQPLAPTRNNDVEMKTFQPGELFRKK